MFRFDSPLFFLLLVLIPLVLWVRSRNRNALPLGLAHLGNENELPVSTMQRLIPLVAYIKYAALVLFIVALARPQWGTRQVNVQTEGINIILAIDLSESMAALDFKREGQIVNRLEAVKGVVRDFIAKRRGDRIGMVVFGSEAYTQVPLTRDYTALATILERLRIGAAGKSTAIGDAVGISLKRLEDIKSQSNIIILLTDGRSNSGSFSPGVASELAQQKGVKIYTVGVGGNAPAPFLVRDPLFGERYVYQKVDIDEKTLSQMARKTGGLYQRAANIKGLEHIYNTINDLEKTKVEINVFSSYREFYPYIIAAACVLLAVWIILTHTRFLRLP